MRSLTRTLWRYGAILVQPRATARALRPHEGLYDGVWLGLLYVLSIGTFGLMRGVATVQATANLSGGLMLVSSLGRILVVPIVTLVACETVLGRARAHRRGLMLVPLVAVVGVAHELAAHGMAQRPFVAEILGGALSVALAWWVRGAIAPRSERA